MNAADVPSRGRDDRVDFIKTVMAIIVDRLPLARTPTRRSTGCDCYRGGSGTLGDGVCFGLTCTLAWSHASWIRSEPLPDTRSFWPMGFTHTGQIGSSFPPPPASCGSARFTMLLTLYRRNNPRTARATTTAAREIRALRMKSFGCPEPVNRNETVSYRV